jgi:hypothetical protein
MAEMPLLWVEVGAHAVHKKPGRNGVVWSGQALEEYKQRKRKEMLKFLCKAKKERLRQKKREQKEKKGQRVKLHRMAAEDNTRENERMIEQNIISQNPKD